MAKDRAEMRDSETAYAKINLALHVRERLPNGYHNIETIFAFLDCGDIISVQEGQGLSLSIAGPFSQGLSHTDNLVLQAANLISENSGLTANASITLDKRLPVASGIGGGSADAAATLRLLNRFWETGFSLNELAAISAPLGADVPACVLSQTCLATGIGQDMVPLDASIWKGNPVLLVNPLQALSTEDVFRAWDGEDRGPLIGDHVPEMALAGRNDLQKPAAEFIPAIDDILMLLGKSSPVLSRMSGSGATCFGIYRDKNSAERAQALCSAAMPECWTMIGELM